MPYPLLVDHIVLRCQTRWRRAIPISKATTVQGDSQGSWLGLRMVSDIVSRRSQAEPCHLIVMLTALNPRFGATGFGMTNWLRKLMPKEGSFFPLFNEHAEKVENAARALKPLLGTGGKADDVGLTRLVDEGRAVADKILDRIRHSFVTPFDRTDIKAMTASMQALLDEMLAVARFGRAGAEKPLQGFGDLIAEGAAALKRGIALLDELDKHADELKRMRDMMGQLRERARKLRDDGSSTLFEPGSQDATATLAGTRLIERAGAIVERLYDVADHIDNLVLDHV